MTNRMNQVEERGSVLKDKAEDLDEVSKEMKKIKILGKEHIGNVGYQQNQNHQIIELDEEANPNLAQMVTIITERKTSQFFL